MHLVVTIQVCKSPKGLHAAWVQARITRAVVDRILSRSQGSTFGDSGQASHGRKDHERSRVSPVLIVRHECIHEMCTQPGYAIRIWALASQDCAWRGLEGAILIQKSICGNIALVTFTIVSKIVFWALAVGSRSITVSSTIVHRERMMSPCRGALGQIILKINAVDVRIVMIGDGSKA